MYLYFASIFSTTILQKNGSDYTISIDFIKSIKIKILCKIEQMKFFHFFLFFLCFPFFSSNKCKILQKKVFSSKLPCAANRAPLGYFSDQAPEG